MLYPGTRSTLTGHLGQEWYDAEHGQKQYFPSKRSLFSQLRNPWTCWIGRHSPQWKQPVQTFPDREARRFRYHDSNTGRVGEYAEIIRQYPDKTTARNEVGPSFSYPPLDCRKTLSSLSDAFLDHLPKLEYISILTLRAKEDRREDAVYNTSQGWRRPPSRPN